MPLDNKISNIIGVRAPEWLLSQLRTRSDQNSRDVRDNDNLLYLANKTAWVRLVSSVDVTEDDLRYFQKTLGDTTITNQEDLAKQFVLFGGTSVYLNKDSYKLRYGLSGVSPNSQKDGAYGMLGKEEIQNYGYRPMPGINSVSIETQGRLGSVRAATVQFKCWDKAQLDVIDALYFKLGYTMFLEWGHTYFYPSFRTKIQNRTFEPGKVASTEFFSIDPFDKNLKGNKEEIFRRIARNSRDSEGNYDAMLGLVSNFTFNYNQEGGYDCTLKIIALGYLTDHIKINNPEGLPNLLKEQIKQYNSLLEKLALREVPNEISEDARNAAEQSLRDIEKLSNTEPLRNYPSSVLLGQNAKDNFVTEKGVFGKLLYVRKLNAYIATEQEDLLASTKIKLNYNKIKQLFVDQVSNGGLFNASNWIKDGVYDIFKNEYKGVNKLSYTIQILRENEGRVRFDGSSQEDSIVNIDEIKQKIQSENLSLSSNSERKSIFIVNSVQASTKNLQLNKITNLQEDIFQTEFNTTILPQIFSGEFPLSTPGFGSKIGAGIESEDISVTYGKKEKTIRVYNIQVRTTFEIIRNSKITVKNLINKKTGEVADKVYDAFVKYPVAVIIKFNDTDLIESLTADTSELEQPFEYEKALKEQDILQKSQSEQTNVNATTEDQENSPLYSMSTIESMLRTIQLYSLNRAITEAGELNLGLMIRDIPMAQDKKFIQRLFSVGIFKNFIGDLINSKKIDDRNYDENTNLNADQRFKIHAKYGFATGLMGNKENLYSSPNNSNFVPVDYGDLLTTYVIPYEKSQNIEEGNSLNHPVYIQFGTLLMLLNHSCTLYDTTGKVQTPMVYIDFNPNHNFCLTNPQQLSTNPFLALIPFEGTDEDYRKLFDDRIISGYNIKALKEEGAKDTPLFRPRDGAEDNKDYVSPAIPKFITSEGNGESMYKGQIMNILLNIDYLMDSIKGYSTNNEENKVFLKPFLEKILSDINKSIGNINVFRLSYNDGGNTLQIVDDQLLPADSKERQLYLSSENNAELPVVGKNSIAKSLEIRTDVSTRLSNMIAISSNSVQQSKSTLSTSGDNFGFINTNYKDRYIENKTEVNGGNSNNDGDEKDLDAEKRAAIQFNKAIKSFYSSPYPAEDQISFSTNYFIDKLIKVKGNDEPTRASSMIPVSVNLTTDGISGFSMGHAFTIPDQLLPYTYSTRKLPNGKSYIDRVGFVVVGLNHMIENNTWNTAVRANMIFLKDRSSYKTKKSEIRQVEKFLDSRDVDGKTARNPRVPNAESLRAVMKELGYKEKEKMELANWGDISQEMSSLASNLFREIKKENPSYTITVTGGNDEYHQTSVSYTSNHIYGDAIDFVFDNYSESGRKAIRNTIEKFALKNPTFGFIDEYQKQSVEASGKHFHIFYRSNTQNA